jgi:hypothetical protein
MRISQASLDLVMRIKKCLLQWDVLLLRLLCKAPESRGDRPKERYVGADNQRVIKCVRHRTRNLDECAAVARRQPGSTTGPAA